MGFTIEIQAVYLWWVEGRLEEPDGTPAAPGA